jgi:ribonuclease BN (tRNA processing enzyme)
MFLLWWSLMSRDREGVNLPHVIASDVTRAHLRALWEHSYNDAPPVQLPFTELPADRAAVVTVSERITLRTWPMPHSTVAPVLGGRFEAEGKVAAFTADTTRSLNVIPLAEGADLLVQDSRYGATLQPDRSDQAKVHTSARDAGEYAEAAGARNLALVHIGEEYAGREAELVAEARTRYKGNVFAPTGGDVFRL